VPQVWQARARHDIPEGWVTVLVDHLVVRPGLHRLDLGAAVGAAEDAGVTAAGLADVYEAVPGARLLCRHRDSKIGHITSNDRRRAR
jgi:hypothetical protein